MDLPPSSPSREILQRSRLFFLENMSESIQQQERLHAASKRPRRTQFVLQADAKVHKITEQALLLSKRVALIQSDFKSLERKVNRLNVVKEQACFFMSPKRVLNEALNKKSPMKLTYFAPNQSWSSDEGFISGGDCSPNSSNHGSPTQTKLVEFLRRRKLVTMMLSKIWDRLKAEKTVLEDIFENNITLLRYKRAEKCLIKMIGLQSKIKTLGKELEGLEERLSLEDNFDEDSSYNSCR